MGQEGKTLKRQKGQMRRKRCLFRLLPPFVALGG